MKKTTLFFVISLLTYSLAFSQNPQLRNKQTLWDGSSVCRNLSIGKISTGILDVFGVQPINLSSYDGVVRDSNFVDLPTLKLLYYGIYTSSLGDNKDCPAPESLQV